MSSELRHSNFDVVRKVVTSRHSCRAFTDQAVPTQVLEKILDTAQQTPSWCNTQPWQTHIVSGQALANLSKNLYERAAGGDVQRYEIDPPVYEGESLARRRAAGWALYEAVGCQRGDREATRQQSLENFRFFGAPHVAFITSERLLGTYGILDCGAYVNAFVTLATSLGIATIPQAAAVSYGPTVREFLKLTDDRVLVCAVSFGYEDIGAPSNSFRTERVDWTAATQFVAAS